MTIRTGFAALAIASLAVFSGCSKNRNDVANDRETFDDIGETRVFEGEGRTASSRSRTNGVTQESVPTPTPIVEAPRNLKPQEFAKKVEKAARKSTTDVAAAPARRQLIGELDIDQ